MGTYALPDLPYDYAALEPAITGQILELHHAKHHAAYVKGANDTLEQLAEARDKDQITPTSLVGLEKTFAFNLSGHVLHSLFWRNLMPKGGGRPKGDLAEAITRDFGSFDSFQKQITEVAGTIMGSGWGALVYEPMAGRLLCSQIYDHQSNLAQAGVPLLVIDAWEHAYYLQYKTEKTKFFEAVWNLWNWEDAAQRFDAARHVTLELAGGTTGA